MTDPTARETAAAGTVALAGSLTVRTAEETCARLRAALAAPAPLRIDCAAAEEADLSLAQLLIAARGAADAAGTALTLAAPLPAVVREMLEGGGFRVVPDGAGGAWFEGEAR